MSLEELLDRELSPFMDDRGRPEEIYRGAIRRLEVRFQRRQRRAERDSVDWVLLAASALLRDRVAAAAGVRPEDLLNPDRAIEQLPVERATAGLAGMEEARAALAEDVNLNVRLVLERAFLRLSAV